MQKLIEQVLEWGVNKGITGPNGKATILTQAEKMMEEAQETLEAVMNIGNPAITPEKAMTDVKLEIGDVLVVSILLCERLGITAEECLQGAYDKISKRTGRMENGTFKKDT